MEPSSISIDTSPQTITTLAIQNNRLTVNFASLALAEGVSRGSGMVVFIIAARLLGVTAIGEIAFAISYVLMFTFVADFGLTTLAVREVARRKQGTDQYGTNVLIFQVLLSLLLITIASGILLFLPLSSPLKAVTFFYVLGLLPLALDMSYLFQAHEKMPYVLLSKTVSQGSYLVIGVTLILVFHSPIVVPIAALIGGLASAGLTYFMLHQVLHFKLSMPDTQFLRVLMISGIPFVSAEILVQVYRNADALLLQFMRGTEALGYYAAGYKIVNGAALILAITQTTFFPLLARDFKRSTRRFRQQAILFSRVTGVLSLPVAVGCIYYAKPIIMLLYGTALLPAVPIFQILLMLLAIISFKNVVISLNIVADQQREYVISGLWAVPLNLVLNLVLISRLGPLGAAIAIVATEAAVGLYLLVTCSRFFTYPGAILVQYLAKPVIAVVAMLLVLEWLPAPLASVYIGMPVGIAIYLGILAIVRGVPRPAQVLKLLKPTAAPARSRGDDEGSGEGHTAGDRSPSPSPLRHPRITRLWRSHRALIVVMLASLLLLAFSGSAYEAYKVYQQYLLVRADVASGLQHLNRVEQLLQPETKQLSLPDAATLAALQTELQAAQQDFARARTQMAQGAIGLASNVPGAVDTLNTAYRLTRAADEACQGGLLALHVLNDLSPLLHGGLLGAASPSGAGATPPSQPVLTMATLEQVTSEYTVARADLEAAIADLQGADLSTLPTNLLSPAQRNSIRQIITRWPAVEVQLTKAAAWLQVAPTLLGVKAPEQFLVELMDEGELRPTGGFIGAYGVMTIQGGSIQPFSLQDIFQLDTPYVRRVGFVSAPPAYSWWPFSAFALRDSNLSFDFPTSAKAGLDLLHQEGGPQVQGVIALTDPVIEHILAITGPVVLPEYGVTVTPTTLEPLIRHYTETGAMAAGEDLPASDQTTDLHERFTAVLGRALMDKLHGLSSAQLIAVAQSLASDLQTKALQIYLSDPAAEALLTRDGNADTIVRGSQDAVTIVDANTSANKANLVTTVDYADTVTLDATGTATHDLTITYNFKHSGDPSIDFFLYGLHSYRTYVRIYAPPNSQLLSGTGFNGGQVQLNHSDEPGRQMWGGYVVVRDGVPYTLHFRWSVPQAATIDKADHLHYTLIFQHQAGSRQALTLKIIPPASGSTVLSYTGALDRDRAFNVEEDMSQTKK